jgi:hypothetical protein
LRLDVQVGDDLGGIVNVLMQHRKRSSGGLQCQQLYFTTITD